MHYLFRWLIISPIESSLGDLCAIPWRGKALLVPILAWCIFSKVKLRNLHGRLSVCCYHRLARANFEGMAIALGSNGSEFTLYWLLDNRTLHINWIVRPLFQTFGCQSRQLMHWGDITRGAVTANGRTSFKLLTNYMAVSGIPAMWKRPQSSVALCKRRKVVMLLQHTCSSYHRHHRHLSRSHSATEKESESETIGPFSGSSRNVGLWGWLWPLITA
jgi:hypothetical protein